MLKVRGQLRAARRGTQLLAVPPIIMKTTSMSFRGHKEIVPFRRVGLPERASARQIGQPVFG
jgi:hypothetical protein